jgi:hypothetical protein
MYWSFKIVIQGYDRFSLKNSRICIAVKVCNFMKLVERVVKKIFSVTVSLSDSCCSENSFKWLIEWLTLVWWCWWQDNKRRWIINEICWARCFSVFQNDAVDIVLVFRLVYIMLGILLQINLNDSIKYKGWQCSWLWSMIIVNWLFFFWCSIFRSAVTSALQSALAKVEY